MARHALPAGFRARIFSLLAVCIVAVAGIALVGVIGREPGPERAADPSPSLGISAAAAPRVERPQVLVAANTGRAGPVASAPAPSSARKAATAPDDDDVAAARPQGSGPGTPDEHLSLGVLAAAAIGTLGVGLASALRRDR